MHEILAAGDGETFFRDWCHEHVRSQVSSERWQAYLRSDAGEAIRELLAGVRAAHDAGAGPEVLIARPQAQGGGYEFMLLEARARSRSDGSGELWHLELAQEDGRWKLMDMD